MIEMLKFNPLINDPGHCRECLDMLNGGLSLRNIAGECRYGGEPLLHSGARTVGEG